MIEYNLTVIAVNQCSTPVSDSENSLTLDNSVFDPRNSPAFPRRRIGPIINADGTIKDDSVSPDVTPNGSLRRRRSRVLPEEDDLMEYLRTSGHDRERKNSTYGSLGKKPLVWEFISNKVFFIKIAAWLEELDQEVPVGSDQSF